MAPILEADLLAFPDRRYLCGGLSAESHLRRQWRELQANPLTGLPGNNQIEQVIKASIKGTSPFAVCYADLNNFKTFNDHYGFTSGDRVLHFSAEVLTDAVARAGDAESDFVGHIGGDDFVIVTRPDRVEGICRAVIERFDGGASSFYSADDLGRGGIDAVDRQGHVVFVPLLTVSLAVVTVRPGEFEHPAQISQTAAEIKQFLKRQPGSGSRYLIDRRA